MTKQKFRLEDVGEGESSGEARVSDSSDLFNRSSNSCGPYCSCNTECKCYDKCDHCRCVDNPETCSCDEKCPNHDPDEFRKMYCSCDNNCNCDGNTCGN